MNEPTDPFQDDALDFTEHSSPVPDKSKQGINISLWLDAKTVAFFDTHAQLVACDPQELMRQALQQYAQGHTLADIVRIAIREEFAKHEQRVIL